MAAVRQVVVLSDKEVRDCIIEKAKLVINGKDGGPQIQGSSKVVINEAEQKGEYSAEVSFERAGK